MSHPESLRADCARCQGLCCVSYPFDRSEWFSFDKAADEPCRHLEPDHGCAEHARLTEMGNGGCANYDCYGAGQRVVEELYRGAAWRSDAALAREMFATFRSLRDVHELRLLLHEAGRLPLSPAQAAEHEQLLRVLEPRAGLDVQTLLALDVASVRRIAHAFLRGLAKTIEPSQGRRRLTLAR